MASDDEQWAPVAGARGYLVSSLGRVFSLYNQALLAGKVQRRRRSVHLLMDDGTRQYKFVYRLVAEAFVPGKTDAKWSVNHIDGAKLVDGHLDDRASNLEWADMAHQHQHALRTGLKARGEKMSRLTEAQVVEVLSRLASGEKQEDLARRFGVGQGQISAIATGRSWRHLSGRNGSFKSKDVVHLPPAGEEWKPVTGCNGYWVSKTGKVWSGRSQRFLQTDKPNKDGRYVKVNLTTDSGATKGFLVHRLVAEAFLPRAEHQCVVNHKNGFSNDASNLQWTTDLENQAHARDSGLQAKSRSRADYRR